MPGYDWPQGNHESNVQIKAIAFLDCCGYSAFTHRHGDLAAVDIHLRMRRAVEQETDLTRVDIVKWLGDGVMLAAESCRSLLTCIYRTMISARDSGLLPLRAGMAYGPVATITHERVDYLGAGVNRAAQLCSDAAPWQLRVDTGHEREMVHFTLRPILAMGAQPSNSASTEPPRAALVR